MLSKWGTVIRGTYVILHGKLHARVIGDFYIVRLSSKKNDGNNSDKSRFSWIFALISDRRLYILFDGNMYNINRNLINIPKISLVFRIGYFTSLLNHYVNIWYCTDKYANDINIITQWLIGGSLFRNTYNIFRKNILVIIIALLSKQLIQRNNRTCICTQFALLIVFLLCHVSISFILV